MIGERAKIILTAVICFVLGGATIVGANQAIQAIQNDQIKIKLNGQVQEFKDETTGEVQYPITYHDRTYLPLRNVAQLSGLNVDYDAKTNTAILNNRIPSIGESDWKISYYDIISRVTDTWDYNEQTKFDFVYLNDDDIPELVFGSNTTSMMIYSFDTARNCAYLLNAPTTGARGATSITYVERENVICTQSGGMLFESEYGSKPGCIGGFGSWGDMIDFDDGWEEGWHNFVFIFDEADESKDVVESDASEKASTYLAKAKEFDLKYTKAEAKEALLSNDFLIADSAQVTIPSTSDSSVAYEYYPNSEESEHKYLFFEDDNGIYITVRDASNKKQLLSVHGTYETEGKEMICNIDKVTVISENRELSLNGKLKLIYINDKDYNYHNSYDWELSIADWNFEMNEAESSYWHAYFNNDFVNVGDAFCPAQI